MGLFSWLLLLYEKVILYCVDVGQNLQKFNVDIMSSATRQPPESCRNQIKPSPFLTIEGFYLGTNLFGQDNKFSFPSA